LSAYSFDEKVKSEITSADATNIEVKEMYFFI